MFENCSSSLVVIVVNGYLIVCVVIAVCHCYNYLVETERVLLRTIKNNYKLLAKSLVDRASGSCFNTVCI